MDPQKEQLKSVLEGLVFASGEDGLSVIQLQSVLTNLERSEIEELLGQIQKEYENRGLDLVNWGGRWKIVASSSVYPYAQKLYESIQPASLSSAAMETLALIAYRQPITRVEIDEIRGVASDMMIKKLQARGLVESCGYKDTVGHPILYQVTQSFLDSFGLEDLSELPQLQPQNVQETLFDESEEV